MRTKFFLYLAIGLLLLIVGYFLWLVIKSVYTIFADARTYRELDKLAGQLAEKRRQRRQDLELRLQNGCQHEFDDALGALPPNVCRKCGCAKEPPAGECDHIWKVLPGIIPESQCQKCGQRFSGVGA
jgi:hypothetical protein